VRLRGPGDLVQAVPYLLGFTGLSDDLALVATRDYLTVLTVRTDLAALTAGNLWPAAGAALTSAQASAVHLVAYPACPLTDAALRALHAHLVGAVAARPAGIEAGRVVTVAQGRWWAHDVAGPAPQGPGTPMADDPALTLGLSVAHGVPAASRAHVVATIARHPDPVLAQVQACLSGLPGRGQAQRLALARDALARRTARPLEWAIPEAAGVLDALQDRRVRDHLLVVCDHEHAAWTWSALLPYAPRRWRPPVATLTAFAAHQRGEGLLARAAVTGALTADPGYALARMFSQVLDLGLTPHQVRDNLLVPAAAELAATPPT
jgi:hypothetical protein